MRTLKLYGLLDHRERGLGGFPSAFDAMIRIKHAHNSRNARLRGPSTRVARQADRAGSRAMIRAIARHDLVASREETSDLDRVFVGLSTAVGEEEGINVSRRDLGELCAQASARLGGHERIRVSECLCLFGNGLNDAVVAVSDVDGH